MDIVLSQDFLPKIGGAHLWLYEIYSRWSSPVKVLTQKCNSNIEEEQEERRFDENDHGSIEIIRSDIAIKDINLFSLKCLSQLSHSLRKLTQIMGTEIATIHCLRAFPEGLVAMLIKLVRPNRIRLVTYAHGEEILVAQTSRQLTFIAGMTYSCSDLVIANSESTRALAKELCKSADIVCIHPGVDVARFERRESEIAKFQAQLGWPNGTIIVSTIARMEPRKNHGMVIKAIADLRKEGYPISYICGGSGPESANLKALANELGIAKWVQFPGRLSEEDKILTFGCSDIYVMPSIKVGEMIEGFGIVFLEAAAAGIPSICGKVGGQGEAVLHCKTGLMVDGESLDEVKSAIKALVGDKSLRRKMGEDGIRWAAEHNWSRVVKDTHKALREHVLCK